MTRSGRILAIATALGLAAAAAAGCPPGVDPLAAEIEGYLTAASAHELRLPGEPAILAQATGGLAGSLLPQLYAWFPSLEGEIATQGGGGLDLEDDLGIGNSSVSVMPAFQFAVGKIGVRFDAFFADLGGQAQVRTEFEFGGIRFPAGEHIDSRVRLDQYRLMFLYSVVRTDNLRLSLEGGFALSVFDARVRGELAGSASESAQVVLPLLGVLVQARVRRFLFEAEIAGMSLSFSDYGGTTLDAKASVGISLFRVVAVRVGYRYLLGRGDSGDFEADVVLHGPFVGVSFQF